MKVELDETNVDCRPSKLWWINDLIEDCRDGNIETVYKNIRIFLGNSSGFICGRGGHHVWIALRSSGERIALITE